jgi:hypothetical protein
MMSDYLPTEIEAHGCRLTVLSEERLFLLEFNRDIDDVGSIGCTMTWDDLHRLGQFLIAIGAVEGTDGGSG